MTNGKHYFYYKYYDRNKFQYPWKIAAFDNNTTLEYIFGGDDNAMHT